MSVGLKIWDGSGRKVLDMADFTVRLVFVLWDVVPGTNYDSRCKAGMIGMPVSKMTTFYNNYNSTTGAGDDFNNLPIITVGNGDFTLSAPVPGHTYHSNVNVYFLVNV